MCCLLPLFEPAESLTLTEQSNPSFSCPIPTTGDSDRVTLAHGEGGRVSRRFIRDHILSRFENEALRRLDDSAGLDLPQSAISFTTDCYTVSPLFFPGGDIGQLAVFGTVNDLAVSGAEPLWLSLGLIIEEGVSIRLIDQVLDSIQAAARIAEIQIVTGDTKVVPRGAADQLYINTAGIGQRVLNAPKGAASLQDGDAIIVSGPIGRHGAAILCARENLDFSPPPASDCAPLTAPLMALMRSNLTPRAIRDATRGGVAAVLHEWAEAAQLSCTVIDQEIPVSPPVRAVSELLGLDPLHLANEGTFVLATTRDDVTATLDLLHQFEVSAGAVEVGAIRRRQTAAVSIIRVSGREVPVEDPPGAPLPRIC